jgi:hypothetical protein
MHMKTLFSRFHKALIATIVGVLAVGGLAFAQVYYGFNPVTGLNGVQGVPVAGGVVPALSGTCGTIPAGVGGAGTFSVTTAGVTTCTLIVTLPSAAPHGFFCVFIDETHPADVIAQASHTSTTCTSSAATITAGDTILVEINGF